MHEMFKANKIWQFFIISPSRLKGQEETKIIFKHHKDIFSTFIKCQVQVHKYIIKTRY